MRGYDEPVGMDRFTALLAVFTVALAGYALTLADGSLGGRTLAVAAGVVPLAVVAFVGKRFVDDHL